MKRKVENLKGCTEWHEKEGCYTRIDLQRADGYYFITKSQHKNKTKIDHL